ncbi:hypothetical protein CFP56_043727 [Quercus suber]|uniref:Uncharacterized protein n=1 Tax=Quercus suber TaxID=58331 RepID=A0AAW0IQA2_QUESU
MVPILDIVATILCIGQSQDILHTRCVRELRGIAQHHMGGTKQGFDLYPTGSHGFSVQREKFTKYDNEKCMKELEVMEGGYLDLGLTLFRVCFKS